MSSDLEKTYNPAAIEAEAYRVWLDENCFTGDPAKPGAPYSIVIPPPNVTGALHLGHAINNTLQDILTRRHRMAGFNTVWIPGIDHAGIATQAVVEKQLKEKENKTRHDIGREALVARIWQWKEQFGNRILQQLQRMGCSCDWSRSRFTLDDMCARAVRETFFKLFKDGLIYRGKRLVNWDVLLQTSISDDEIYHETVKTFLWHIRYPIVGSDKQMVVATTRPETMLGDTAVAVHSQDPRWNWAIGKAVELPLTGRKIPIIADDILVDPKFGTGVVKVTPAHDPNDYAVWQRHQGKPDQIDLINILNADGTINQNGGPYAGLKREVARKKVVADLSAQGRLEKEEPYETEVGHSDRSKTPVEPYLSDQWFVKMAPLAEPALEVVRNGTIKFFPERHAQQYLAWLGEKRDWPISRQLWWGHRIPVWKLPVGTAVDALFASRDSRVSGPNDDRFAGQSFGGFYYICVRNPGDVDAIRELEDVFKCVQDPDVLDTWFSSALWPHSTLGWPPSTGSGQGTSADLAKWYPTSVLLTGRDIITLWVARMVMMGMYNMGRAALPIAECRMPNGPHPNPPPEYRGRGKEEDHGEGKETNQASGKETAARLGIPFHHVAINPTILDGKGERMSKSKGNGVDPVDVIDTHGADALRFTLATMATETQDVRMPVKKDALGRNTSDKFDFGRNFCNKLWNAARFVLAQDCKSEISNLKSEISNRKSEISDLKLSLPDRWILSRFNRAVTEADDALKLYRFDQYAKTCYDFFWRDLCDWYVEAAKPALRDPQSSARTAAILTAMLDGALRLLHPIIPFITERLWWRLNEVCPQRGAAGHIDCPPSKRLILAAWPKAGPVDEAAEKVFAQLQELITAIRNVRNVNKVDLKLAVDVSICAPAELVADIDANRGLIELLATCKLKAVKADLPPVANAARATAVGCDLFIEGLVDPSAEKQRSGKRREELEKIIKTLQGRLGNAGYIAKAPVHLVAETRKQLEEAQTELEKLT